MLLPLLLAAATPDLAAAARLFAPVDRHDGAGCAVDVRRDGRPVFQHAYGMADLEGARPNTLDTVFEAGSVSKQFTGALVAILVDRGKLRLDDPIRRWLPELPPLYDGVTIAMLLHHTSGVRNWDNLIELTGWPEGTRVYTPDDAMAAIARQQALNNAPGAEYLYSNSNYVLAARIVARASGQSIDDFSREALFAPLGMTATRWRSDFRAVVPDRAQAYTPGADGKPVLDMPFGNVVGPGSLLTTVGDLQRWQAVLDHPSAEQAKWVGRLTERARLTDGTEIDYALGLELGPIAGQRAISHAGATAGYRAWAGRFPDQQLSIALLCNAGELNTEDMGPELAALFLPPPPASAVPAANGTTPPAGVAGLYRNLVNDQAVTVAADGAAIRFAGGVPFTPGDGADRLVSRDGRRRATLTRDARGEVQVIVLTRIGNAPARLVRASPATATTDLKIYQGRYRSAEIDGDQTFAIGPKGLMWIDPHGLSQPLTPTYADGFAAAESSWTLRFVRDGRGGIAGLDMSITRARRIHFGHLPDPR